MQGLKKYTLISIGLLGISTLMALYQSSCAFQPVGSNSDPESSPHSQPAKELVTIFKGDAPDVDAKRQQRITQAIQTHNQSLFHSDSPFKGPENSDITLVVFFDYQCGHCKMIAPVLETLQNNNPMLKIVYKELPILGESSVYAAKAALAAQTQGKYNFFGTQLMQSEDLSKPEILKIAASAGLNVDQLQRAIDSQKIDNEIKNNMALAKDLTVKGTPVVLLVHEQPKNNAHPISKAFFITGNAELETLQELVNKLRDA